MTPIPVEWAPGCCCLQTGHGRSRRLLWFSNPVDVIETSAPGEVGPCLDQVEKAAEAGRFAVGYLAYEAAAGLDSALPATPSTPPGTLLWFGIYEAFQCTRMLPPPAADARPDADWTAERDPRDYLRAVSTIRDYIAQGDCYQANFTFPFRSDSDWGHPDVFLRLLSEQGCAHGALIHTGTTVIVSASPEQFYQLRGHRIECRPMKGTASRGPSSREDAQQAQHLRSSPKDQAENIMIVDMIRNDLGRIARPGSVRTGPLFSVEPYPTVHQMTSRVEAETDAGLRDIMTGLFPCASVTGAPKKRSMELLRELEGSPRGIYTGCIGWVAPRRRHRFNVAIRTVVADVETGQSVFQTGSGVVWDSRPEKEYRECLSKTVFLHRCTPEFEVLETLRSDDGVVFLLDRHIQRMSQSAAYFGFLHSPSRIRSQLMSTAQDKPGSWMIRATLNHRGRLSVQATPIQGQDEIWPVALLPTPIDSNDPFLSHKTTHRTVYQNALDAFPNARDVLLMDENGLLTESCFGNIVLGFGGSYYTPTERPGLLPGTLRAEELENGRIQEKTLTVSDLHAAEELFILNSVRNWMWARVLPTS